MNLNKKNINFVFNLEKFIFFITLLVIPVSKAGLNVSISLLILAYLFRLIFSSDFREFIAQNRIFLLMAFLFILGGVISFVSGGGVLSFSQYLRHYVFLIISPYFIYFYRDSVNWKASIVLLSLGMLVGGLFSYWNAANASVIDLNSRITSFWDVSRWGEFIVYFILLAFPYGEVNKRRWVVFLCVSLFLFFPLLWTGCRAPLLMLILLISSWFIFQVRYWKISVIASFAIVFSLLIWLSPNILDVTILRLESIANIKDNYSNLARLYMWKYALLFQLDNIQHNAQLFFLGTGYHHLDVYFKPFIENVIGVDSIVRSLNGQFSLRDHHNIFLNVLSMHGVLFFSFYVVFLGCIYFKSLSAALSHSLSWSFVFILTAYLGIGFFFGISGGYSAIFVSILLSLAYQMPLSNRK